MVYWNGVGWSWHTDQITHILAPCQIKGKTAEEEIEKMAEECLISRYGEDGFKLIDATYKKSSIKDFMDGFKACLSHLTEKEDKDV